MTFQELWWKTGIAKWLKTRRFAFIVRTMGLDLTRETEMLEVGSATGKDFIAFLKDYPNFKITGIDIDKYEIDHPTAVQIQGDAENLPFEDKSFDFVISLGLLEHIEPIEKLSKVIMEIDRVAKSYCIVIPAINTRIEPHLKSWRWQLRDRNYKKQFKHAGVNYYSDDAWTKFTGFKGANTKRFWYIPGLISNLVIYKTENE